MLPTPKTWVVELVAATASGRPPRPPGIDALIRSLLCLAAGLATPLFALQLGLVRLATLSHPLAREPLLTLAIDSSGAGLILAAELIRIWRPDIDRRLAASDALPPSVRRWWRLRTLLVGAAVVAGMPVAAYYGLIAA
jgi:hypothetical protein